MNELDHIWTAVTPMTFTATTIVAGFFAAFLWNTRARVIPRTIITTWLGAFIFIIICGSGRYFDKSPLWETYIGSAILWTWFCIATSAYILVWRTIAKRE
jgi:hypothetical protein